MRVLVIGGTRFTGPFVVRQLVSAGHEVTVFHRGQHDAELPAPVGRLQGDRRDATIALMLRETKPDVLIDMIAFTRQDAESLVQTFRGVAQRVIVPSSEDVYRAYGRLHRTEPGPPDPTPLTEDSPLREKLSIHDDAYEKLAVEQVVMSQPDLPGTILRLPAIYGPGDHRLYDHTRPMLDGRPIVLLEQGYANWRWTHGYVENVAHAIALAATDERAAGRIYNVGEAQAPRQLHRVGQIAEAARWHGEIVVLPASALPERFERLDWSQDWTTDTTRIREELGYREIMPYDVGLLRTVEWHRDHPDEKLAATSEQNAEDDAIAAASSSEQPNVRTLAMPMLINQPTVITAAGNKPKLIEEYIGRVNSKESRLSIARMKSPSGWVEPGQRPEFDEFTVVLSGTLHVKGEGGVGMEVLPPGQAVIAHAGEWVQYSTPGPEGAEYVAVCLPAFSPQTVHRDV